MEIYARGYLIFFNEINLNFMILFGEKRYRFF